MKRKCCPIQNAKSIITHNNMKKTFIILFTLLLLVACKNQTNTNQLYIDGKVKDGDIEKVYLFSVVNEQYQRIKLLDSIAITDNKFEYKNDTLKTELYFISTMPSARSRATQYEGSYVFLSRGKNNLEVSKLENEKLMVENTNSAIAKQYQAFHEERAEKSNKRAIDSLSNIFYQARDVNDRAEMDRINEIITPLQEEAYDVTNRWLTSQIKENKGTLLGLYIHYTYRFQNSTFPSMKEINEQINFLDSLNDEAKESGYYSRMQKRIDLMKLSAVGSIAPEIKGLNMEDQEVKLSDFRGTYVLVDFWSSTCSWCRKETPVLKKTYDTFKDKNFTILGVSSDTNKEDWIKAIEEDKANWDHIILKVEDMNEIMNNYSIVGIPQILLVDPDGKILAQGLRGNDIYNAAEIYIKTP